MLSTTAIGGEGGFLNRLADWCRARPEAAFAWILAAHVLVWTALPLATYRNLQLDLVEDFALGKEWQLGYWKHPPLPWWLADLAYRAVGDVRVIYLLGPLAVTAAMYGVWRLAREVVPPTTALVAVLALEGSHFFNFTAVKFAHDQLQLPFWALTGWLVYRALTGGRLHYWILAGGCLGLAFWSKYAAFVLAATLGLFLLLDPDARRAWRTPGPYAMALTFIIVLAPNLVWLVNHDFLPFLYVEEKAHVASRWYEFVTFPLSWVGSELFFLVPVILMLAVPLAAVIERNSTMPETASAAFARRYVTVLALGPFLLTTLIAAMLGRMLVARWGYPLWLFAPLAALMWFPPQIDARAWRRFAATFLLVAAAYIIAYPISELLEPLLHDRPKATEFPGQVLADTVTQEWRARTGMPLRYILEPPVDSGGAEFPANMVAVYSADRPHVVVHGDLRISPWVDPADLARQGGIVMWFQRALQPDALTKLKARFPGMEIQQPLILKRSTIVATEPAIVGWALLPPRR